jgi:hypothetical protein
VTPPAPRGRHRRPAARLSLVVFAAALTVTCTKIPTDPNEVFSLAVDSLPGPSVVAGDTLRDTTGVVAPLTGRAYNIQGHVLTSVLVRFISLSPNQLTIDAQNHALGAGNGDSIVRVVADANGLQSLPFLVPVVLKPTSIVHADTDSSSTIKLSLTSADSNLSVPLVVLLKHQPDTAGRDSVTRSYLLRYQITYPAAAAVGTGTPSDTTLPAYLVNSSFAPPVPSRTDTTNGNGLGNRNVLFNVPRIAPGSKDSVVVAVAAVYRDSAVVGSPLRFVIHYTAP